MNSFKLQDASSSIDSMKTNVSFGIPDLSNSIDIIKNIEATIKILETANDLENISTEHSILTSDQMTALDNLSFKIKMTLYDLGISLDFYNLLISMSVRDTEYTDDQTSINGGIYIWDTITPLELILKSEYISIFDQMNMSEEMKILVKSIIQQDSKSIDWVNVFLTAKELHISDIGSAIDSIDTFIKTQRVYIHDYVSSNEYINNIISLKLEDLQLLSDTIKIIGASYRSTDIGKSTDEILSNIVVTLLELTQTLEEISISNYLNVNDIGYGLDKLIRILYIYCFNLHIILEKDFNGEIELNKSLDTIVTLENEFNLAISKVNNFASNITKNKNYDSQIDIENYNKIVKKIKELYKVIK